MILPLYKFAYKDKIYKAGTKMLINTTITFADGFKLGGKTPVTFYSREKDKLIVYASSDTKTYYHHIYPDWIKEILTSPTEENPNGYYDEQKYNNLKNNISDNFDQWVLYIMLMGIATIFKGNWFLWILLTIFVKPHSNK